MGPEDLYINEGNSSRRPTDEELAKDFGLLKCQGNCEDEINDLGYTSLPVLGHSEMSPCTIDADATPAGTVTVTVTADPPHPTASTMSTISNIASRALTAAQSMITESVEYAFYDEGDN
jgi:hypothetical protein